MTTEGQIVGQRVELKGYMEDPRQGRVCAWLPLNNLRAVAVVEMDDGGFELVPTDVLRAAPREHALAFTNI